MSDQIIEKLKKEEEELEKLASGNRSQEPPDDSGETEENDQEVLDQQSDEDISQAEVITSTTEDDTGDQEQDTPPQRKRVSYKTEFEKVQKRFNNYKASTDVTIHDLRSDNTKLYSQVETLRKELNDIQSKYEASKGEGTDLLEGVFTEEDIANFGEDGISTIKRAVDAVSKARTEPLERKLREAQEQRAADAERAVENQRKSEYDGFLRQLTNLVPDALQLNEDQGWLEWMQELDPYSRRPRAELFQRAEASRDVARVAEFFLFYKEEKGLASQSTQDEMDQHVTPVGTGAGTQGTTQSSGKKMKLSFINEFYRNVTKPGFYTKQEADKIEAQIDHAVANGLVDQSA